MLIGLTAGAAFLCGLVAKNIGLSLYAAGKRFWKLTKLEVMNIRHVAKEIRNT